GAMNMVRGTLALAAAGAAPLRRWPHDPQKAKAAPTVLPHLGQTTVSPLGPVAGTPPPGVGEAAGTIPGTTGSDWWARAGPGVGAEAATERAPVERPTAEATPVFRPVEGETSTPAATAGLGPSLRRASVAEVLVGAAVVVGEGAGAGAGAGAAT